MTKKIVAAACRNAKGSSERLKLGNTKVERDWGWAPEYVDAMWRISQQRTPDDFVIASGTTHSLQDFVPVAFKAVGLGWRERVDEEPALFRPTDIAGNFALPAKAEPTLAWRATIPMAETVRRMVDAKLRRG